MTPEYVEGGVHTTEELAEDLINSRADTGTVIEGDLGRYLRAGRLSGYQVWVIAEVGDKYLTGVGFSVESIVGENVVKKNTSQLLIISDEVPKGSLGIAIKRPDGSEDFEPFREALKTIPE